MSNIVTMPYDYFADPTKGRPVYNGSIYIGVVDLDPTIVANQLPIRIRQEDGTEVSVSQPVSTGAGGTITYLGSPAQVVVDSSYSIAILNSLGSQVYYAAEVSGVIDSPNTDLRYSPKFATVAAMVAGTALDGSAVTFALGMVVGIADYATGNNSGLMIGSIVAAGTATADGGSYIDVTGFQWRQNFQHNTATTKQFGCVADGATTDHLALIAAFAYGAANNIDIQVSSGNHAVSASVASSLSGEIALRVKGASGSKITALAGFPAGKLVIFSGSSGGQLWFEGIELDATNVPNSGAGEANDALYVNCNLDDLKIRYNYIHAGATQLTAGSDSGIFTTQALRQDISYNRIAGFPDAGIYLSGDATGLIGEESTCLGNNLSECSVAIISKRVLRKNIVNYNFISDCSNGIGGGEADGLLSGTQFIVIGNELERTTNNIFVRQDSGATILGNIIREMGYSAASIPSGILIQGSSDTNVTGNTIVGLNPLILTPTSAMTGIRVESRLIDAVTYLSENNLVASNVISGIYTGISETANSVENSYMVNKITGATVPYTLNSTTYNLISTGASTGNPFEVTSGGNEYIGTDGSLGRLAIGHITPTRHVHFADGYASGVAGDGGATGTNFLWEASGALQHNFVAGSGSDVKFLFGDTANNNRAEIRYARTTDVISFHAAADVRMDANSVANSSRTTGGTGSAGAGNQYVELTINGVTYKVLHDGTV